MKKYELKVVGDEVKAQSGEVLGVNQQEKIKIEKNKLTLVPAERVRADGMSP